MRVDDRVYGKIDIEGPVLLELINSKPLQRLKKINQAGASKYAIAEKTVSRYEHSVGVMILLKKLGASIEEQIAGLLHDVPHTAFSHVIDYVFTSNEHQHEFHEKFHSQIIKNSEIPSILKKFDYKLDRILDENNFPLLERPLPDLCADRIDYALRDRMAMQGDPSRISGYIKNFVIENKEIIFGDKNTAKSFAEDYLEMDYKYWSHPREVALFQILANAVKFGLENKIISQDDLFQDDDFVYSKLKQSKNKEILEHLAKLNPKLEIDLNPKNYDFYSRNKLRYVDPKFVDSQNSIKRTTEVYPKFANKLKEHADWVEAGNYIKIISY